MEEPRRQRVADEERRSGTWPLSAAWSPSMARAPVGEDDRVDAVERERTVRVLVDGAHPELPAPSASIPRAPCRRSSSRPAGKAARRAAPSSSPPCCRTRCGTAVRTVTCAALDREEVGGEPRLDATGAVDDHDARPGDDRARQDVLDGHDARGGPRRGPPGRRGTAPVATTTASGRSARTRSDGRLGPEPHGRASSSGAGARATAPTRRSPGGAAHARRPAPGRRARPHCS